MFHQKCFGCQSEEDLEEEEHILGLDELERRGGKQSAGPAGNTSKPELVLESNQDAAEWKLEVERVMPQLLPDKKRSEKAVSIKYYIYDVIYKNHQNVNHILYDYSFIIHIFGCYDRIVCNVRYIFKVLKVT